MLFLDVTSRLLNEWNPLNIININMLGHYYDEESIHILDLLNTNKEKHHTVAFGHPDMHWLGEKIYHLFTKKYPTLFKTDVTNCYSIADGILKAKMVLDFPGLDYKLRVYDKIYDVKINTVISDMNYFFRLVFDNQIYDSDFIHIIHFDESYLLYSLQQSLNANMKLIGCLTCKFSNENPYGGFEGEICFKEFDVSKYKEKIDILDSLQELCEKENYLDYFHDINYLCDDYKEQTDAYQYNIYNFYSNNNEQKEHWIKWFKSGPMTLKGIEGLSKKNKSSD